jgi:hypothetical protein
MQPAHHAARKIKIVIPIPKRELSSPQIDEVRSVFETHLARK